MKNRDYVDGTEFKEIEKKCNDGFEYAIQLTRVTLIPFGLWPLKFTCERCIRPILVLICIILLLFVTVPLILYIFLLLKDYSIRVKLCGPLGFSLMNLFKYLVVIIKRRKIADCMNDMAKDWRQAEIAEYRQLLLKNARIGRLLTVVCVILMFTAGMPYVVIIPLTKGPKIVGNLTYRSLAYPGYFIFFNPHIRPIYDFVLSTQIVCALVRYSATCGVYSIIIVCVMHICSQIAITSAMLQKLTDDFDKQLLGKIVQQHLRFLDFASRVEDIFNEICLVDVLGSTGILCFLGYSFILEYEQRETIATVTYFLLLMSFVFNIFILCYIGQILTEKCEEMGTTAYMIDWYKLSGKDARNMVMLVSSKQRRVALTAGKIVTLSLRSFTSIIKAAASYLNMIRTVEANAT